MKPAPPSPEQLRFAVIATDVALFTMRDSKLFVRMIRVDRPPFFDGIPGLPGGLILSKETAEQAVTRIIHEKARVKTDQIYIEQLYTFSDVQRDPRGRVVAVAYSAYIPWQALSEAERESLDGVWWERVPTIHQKLAYDHAQMLAMAIERLQSRITYTTLISKLLPKEFTLTELERAYAMILHKPIDKRNFRKKLEKLHLLRDTGHKREGEKWRPAKLYAFKKTDVQVIEIL